MSLLGMLQMDMQMRCMQHALQKRSLVCTEACFA